MFKGSENTTEIEEKEESRPLNEEEKKEVKEAFKDWEPRDFSEMVKLEEKREKKEWMRAYRRFNLDTSELFKEKEEN